MQFIDRQSAGQALARELQDKLTENTVIVALPRGGVILGFEAAKSLDVPLGIILARKIGHPAFSAFSIAAVAEGEILISNETGVLPVDELWLTAAEEKTRHLIAQQRSFYFSQKFSQPDITDSTAILVDDGMTTGLTMQAAIHAVRRMNPAIIAVAVPVASHESIELIEPLVDGLLTLDSPQNFLGEIESHYLHYPHVNDITVRQLLERSNNGIRKHTAPIHS